MCIVLVRLDSMVLNELTVFVWIIYVSTNIVVYLDITTVDVTEVNLIKCGWGRIGVGGLLLSSSRNNHFHLLQTLIVLVKGIILPFLLLRNLGYGDLECSLSGRV